MRSVYERAPNNLKRALDLSSEKGSSVWLTVVPLQELGFNLNKREFRDAIKLRYDWPIEDIPTRCVCGSSVWLTVVPLQELGFNLNKREFRDAIKLRYDWPIEDIPTRCVCGDIFSVDHSMVCKKGGFIIQRHNELRDLEADLLSMVCNDVEIEPQLQDVTGEQLSSGSNLAREARLDIHARGFWEQHQSALFDIRVCHPNTESYKQLEPKQIYRLHENEKKRSYSTRALDIEHGSFTPLVFTSVYRWNGPRMFKIS